jgi:hypothetical protein
LNKDEFVVRKTTHEDLAGLPKEVRNMIYGVNDYEVDKYASDLWKSIIQDPVDLLNKKFFFFPKEIRRLSSRLQFSEHINIFSNAHKGLLLSTYHQDKPHEVTQLLRLILRAL